MRYDCALESASRLSAQLLAASAVRVRATPSQLQRRAETQRAELSTTGSRGWLVCRSSAPGGEMTRTRPLHAPRQWGAARRFPLTGGKVDSEPVVAIRHPGDGIVEDREAGR